MIQLLQTMMADREAERAERQANLAALQQLAHNNQGHGNHDHPGSKLKNFQNTNPPMFSKTEEPLDVDDWLQTIENNLEVAGMMTWEDFKLKFSKYHVPQGLIKKMRDEFRELKQGRMSVVEYRDMFLTLSRPPTQTYRPNHSNNNGGPPKPGGNNNNNNHNSNNNNGSNTNTNTGPRTGSNAIPVTPKDKSTINCYECGVVGHYSKECPKKLAKIATNTAAPAQQQRRFAVPSWSSPTHGIGQASRAQTRQKRARHAVSAPRRRPGRARARHRTAASALPYLSISASRTLTPPATHQTSSLASGGPVDVAMIKVLPPRYCTHLIDASTPPSSLCCLFTRASPV
ncbi:hypothetical protein QYE76_052695 [Lolium multiflorum]|uniref:CCHC-type domain-containing protein n=1 Tax=Lolium multiflorum TaxID=4521 RepID=A0AAD8SVV3_LOLMU|nr:hypothetical protein QYE76_052695 [Lolium multiflorum]